MSNETNNTFETCMLSLHNALVSSTHTNTVWKTRPTRQRQQVAHQIVAALRESLAQSTGKPLLDVLSTPHNLFNGSTPPELATMTPACIQSLCQVIHRAASTAFESCVSENPSYGLNMLHELTEVLWDATGMENQQRLQELEAENARLRAQVAQRETVGQRDELAEAILEATDFLVVVLDTEGRIVRFNQACERSTGYTVQEVLGKRVWDMLIPAEQVEGVKGVFHALAFDQMPNRYENHWIAKDGQRRLLSWSNTLLRDENGNVSYIIATAQDITEKRQSEEQLRIFQALVENSPDGIGMTNLNGIVTYSNPGYQSLLGYTTDLVGTNLLQSYDEDPQYLMGLVQKVTEEGRWQGELTYRRQDGTTFPGQLTAFTICDEQGTLLEVAGIFRDISGQKQIENELRTFKAVVDNASDAIAITDRQGTIVYYNDAYRKQYRCGDNHMGEPIAVLVAPDDQEQLPGILREIVEEGIWKGQLLHIRQDGTTFPALESCFVTRNNEGEVETMVGIVRDISELVAAEEERLALQAQVIAAQEEALRELSTPLLPLDQNVVAMPLVGTIDSKRAQLVMETLLEGIAAHQAEIAIVDITGVKVVDTQVAQAIIRAAQAVRLLGAQVLLTGIQPQIAQTLVHLGADMSGIVTRSTLQSGIAYALNGKEGVHYNGNGRRNVASRK